MSDTKHDLHCLTCGHTLAAGQELDYFAQYGTIATPETIDTDLLESVDNLFDCMEPVALTLGHMSTDCHVFLEDDDITHMGWLLWRLCKEARQRVRYIINERDARDRQQRDTATAQPADEREEG